MHQLGHHVARGRIAHHEQHVNPVGQQRLGQVALGVDELGAVARLDAVEFEQRQGQRPGAAALFANVQPHALELGQRGARLAAVKDHQRLVGNTAERHQPADIGRARFAAQHETDIDLDLGVVQALEVLHRAVRRQDLEGDAIALEDLAVFLGIAVERAALGAAGHDDGVGHRKVGQRQHRQPGSERHAHGDGDGRRQVGARHFLELDPAPLDGHHRRHHACLTRRSACGKPARRPCTAPIAGRRWRRTGR